MLVWPSFVPDQCSLSYLLLKFVFNSFLGKGLYSVCVCVCVCVMPVAGVRPGVGGPCIHDAGNWSECGYVNEHLMANEDQAGPSYE